MSTRSRAAKERRGSRDQDDEAYLDRLFPPLSFNEIRNHRRADKHYIAGEGWLKRGVATLLIGGTGIGKSVLAEQIAAQLVTGKPLLGGIKVHHPCRVLLVEAENDREDLQLDFTSITRQFKLPLALLQKNLQVYHVPGLPSSLFADWLDRVVRRFKPDVIIVDPYQAFVGGADMNRSDSFLRWVGPIELILHTHQCAMLLVVHTPKPKGHEEWTAREMVYLLAGTSAVSNWARASCELLNLKREGNRFRLHFSKRAEKTGLLHPNGQVIRDLYVEHSSDIHHPFWRVSEDQSAPVRANVRALVELTAHDHPAWSHRKIAESLRISVSTVNQHYPEDLRKKKAKARQAKRKAKE